jgi:hypothetical protein
LISVIDHRTKDAVMRKAQTKVSPNGTVTLFKQLKRKQIETVKVLMKVLPAMIAARAEQMSSPERQKLEDKIEFCRDRIRFCYFLYTDAAELLGPKPAWLEMQ